MKHFWPPNLAARAATWRGAVLRSTRRCRATSPFGLLFQPHLDATPCA